MRGFRAALCVAWIAAAGQGAAGQTGTQVAQAKAAYEQGNATKAVEILKGAEKSEPNNGEIQLLLTKAYLQLDQYDAAVSSGEKAVALQPKNSEYHRWLGEAYGAKADHASMLSAYSLARKTQKEFATAVELDEKNYEAAQDLVEYDCTAPGVVGGGEDKAQPIIQKLMTLDVAQGYYAAGNCRAAKKDLAGADAQFAKALQSKPSSIELVFKIADYYQQRANGAGLAQAVSVAEGLNAADPRTKYYKGVAQVLQGQNLPAAEGLLKEFAQTAPARDDYPAPFEVHYWLGQVYAKENKNDAAAAEYQTALKLNPKSKRAQEGLKALHK